MIYGYEVELDRIGRVATAYEFHKFTAAFGSNHGVAGPVQDRCPNPSESIEARRPIRLAFFHPFPGQRPLSVERIIVPRHPSRAVPIMPSFGRDGLRAHTHHVERRRDEDQPLDLVTLLSHQPRDPPAQSLLT